jgi:hypothetical protein
MSISELDGDLAVVYGEYGVPVDRLLTEPKLGDGFVKAVETRVGRVLPDKMGVLRRVVNLRKDGRLPRLQRRFRGRHAR